MNKIFLKLCFSVVCFCGFSAGERHVIDLNGPGWQLWYDADASWQHDELFQTPVEPGSLPAGNDFGQCRYGN
ncbi:MAG: hypothetical protein AB7D05_08685 [Mangrovibacterium sp.]